MNAKFITLEGIDGAGKSTHLQWIANWLREHGHEVVVTREPGGTPLGETLRGLLLSEPMSIETEAMLMFASRREHLDKVIHPALARGAWVISDRFTDASFAYQCGGRGIPEERLKLLEDWVHQNFQPYLTLLFDAPVEIAQQRLISSRQGSGGEGLDRFELEQAAFFHRVRDMYLRRAAQNPQRIRIIDSGKSISDIHKELEEILISI